MYNVLLLNKISKIGLDKFGAEYNTLDTCENPDAILVRSAAMHDMDLPENLLSIARAGAGVNNIPLDKCSEKGICVFNTPGANANAVKELVVCGLLLSSRKILNGIEWVKTLKGNGDQVGKMVEKGKSSYSGPEIFGKTIGILGLGAIGILVASAANSLGMKVIGYDPFISEENKSKLPKDTILMDNINDAIKSADYLTLHMPLLPDTKGIINKNTISLMKDGARILNFARDGLVVSSDIIEALNSQKLSAYVTDFVTDDLIGVDGVIALPHLGASTPESEDNCAIMAVDQTKDFLENGNIKNSVNLPNLSVERSGTRVCIVFKKCDKLPSICEEIGKTTIAYRNNYGYAIIDDADESKLSSLNDATCILKLRVIK